MPGNLPPSASDGVFAITAGTVIDAPIEKVWEALLDFPSYPEWNSLMRSQVIVEHSDKPLQDQTPREGSYIALIAHLPPSMDPPRFSLLSPAKVRLVVSHLDPDNYRVAWTNRMPPWLMTTERWQWLTVVESESEGKTKYETIEVFKGPAAWIAKWLVAPYLRLGFRAMADDLKKRSEAQYRQRN